MILFLFDLLILGANLLTFAIVYTVCRWIHCSELSAILIALLWSCFSVGFGVWRQGSSRFQPNQGVNHD